MSKHPELSTTERAEGVSYACAYMRLEHGWSLERAVSVPPRKPRPTRTLAERHAFYAAKRAKVAKRVLVSRLAPVKRAWATRHAEDTSPVRIRRIRAAYCEQFIKFGTLDPVLGKQLRDYADECRAFTTDPQRVPDEPPAQRHGQEVAGGARHGNDSRRHAMSVDAATAELIGDFLRVR